MASYPCARLIAIITLIVILISCGKPDPLPQHAAPHQPGWPALKPVIGPNAAIEQRIKALLENMPLEQKIGQMMQPSIAHVSPEEVKRYYIGSVLNGGGMFPNGNRYATPQEWQALADAYYQASMAVPDGVPAIPVIWATDAVHGHNNVVGATLFPHNSALGAANNPELVRLIGAATAQQMVATGLDWNFAPTVAVAKNARWGRTYESFSENPGIVAALSAAYVAGLQGYPNDKSFLNTDKVIATAKHFIGDGATTRGDDQGDADLNEQQLIAEHALGYFSTLSMAVQTVMISYSSVQGLPMHGNKHLITDILKNQLHFDGIVVSDWNALGHVPGCTRDNCAAAINAGIDVLMVPYKPDWPNMIANTIAQVKSGEISMQRIDDAVSRILRVKLRSGVFNKPKPSQRSEFTYDTYLSTPEHKALARRAVRESLVLLKNNDGVLPIAPNKNILIAGDGANNVSRQTGGWTISWQGDDTTPKDFPVATTVFQGFESAVQAAGGTVHYSATGEYEVIPDVAVVVFGERPAAEMSGDIENLNTLEFNHEDPEPLKVLQKLKAAGIPTVAVFIAGRPRLINKELNQSSAFVMAWFLGSEGGGIADLLLANQNSGKSFDFQGKLPFVWPATPCHVLGSQPQFNLGYGLSYAQPVNLSTVPEDYPPRTYGCDLPEKFVPSSAKPIDLSGSDFQLHLELKSLESKIISDSETWHGLRGAVQRKPAGAISQIDLEWQDAPRNNAVLQDGKVGSLLANLAAGHALQFEIKVNQKPSAKVWAKMECGHLCAADTLEITQKINTLPISHWQQVYMPLACIAKNRSDLFKINSGLRIDSSGYFSMSLRHLKIAALNDDDAINLCE